MKTVLKATASTQKDIQDMINTFFCSENYYLTDDLYLNNDSLSPVELKLTNKNYRVVIKANRYRFEGIIHDRH